MVGGGPLWWRLTIGSPSDVKIGTPASEEPPGRLDRDSMRLELKSPSITRDSMRLEQNSTRITRDSMRSELNSTRITWDSMRLELKSQGITGDSMRLELTSSRKAGRILCAWS